MGKYEKQQNFPELFDQCKYCKFIQAGSPSHVHSLKPASHVVYYSESHNWKSLTFLYMDVTTITYKSQKAWASMNFLKSGKFFRTK